MNRSAIFSYIFVVLVLLIPGFALASLQPGWQASLWTQDYEAGLKKSAQTNRPAIIYFDALWCSWCQQLKRDVLDRPEVKAKLKASYIPIIIDFDARPDLFGHYRGRGLPYTVFVAPDGKVLNRFVGILTVNDFIEMLDEYSKPGPGRVVEVNSFREIVNVSSPDQRGLKKFREAFLEHLDTLYSEELQTLAGQFETGATLKRPSPRTWAYLLSNGLWRDRVSKAITVERARLLDRQDGGFFNFLDPGRPGGDYLETSKLLEANARLVEWFASVAAIEKNATIAADSGWYYLREVLWDKKRGGFWQSQLADNRYYALAPGKRTRAEPPAIDRIKRADTNAEAALSIWRAGQLRNNPEMKRYARRTLDFIFEHMIHDGDLYHVKSNDKLSVTALPEDWFWLLMAAREIKTGSFSPTQRRQLNKITIRASDWLKAQIRVSSAPTVELASLVAQIGCDRITYPAIPEKACTWAIRNLRIEPTTRPDDVVLGIQAWEQWLETSRP